MAVVVVNEQQGGTQEIYEQNVEKVMPEGQLPEGCQLHIAGPGESGWRVITVWDSEEQFEQFRNEKLMPVLSEAGVAPKITVKPAHRIIT
jgi:heme-degrading monooxygenase HmoA